MKAAQISEYGGKEVVTITETQEPQVVAGKVLVSVKAASVNPFDIKVRDGMVRQMKELTFPATLGGDFSGVIKAVGDDVTEFAVGDEVFGQANALGSQGSFAEVTITGVGSFAKKPMKVDFTTAAALPLVAVSAYQALVDVAQLQAGQKVLIHGAAGGIGSVAVQIAHNLGADVSATASSRDLDYVKSLGADTAIDYATEDSTAEAAEFDVVFDTVGGETNTKSYGVVKAGGILVSMAQPIDEALATQKGIRYEYMFTGTTTERLNHIAQLVDAGKVTINVDKIFPLEETGEAMDYLKNGHPRGKVVIQIA